jgi:integrase
LRPQTVDYYQQHLDRHIIPVIGAVKLSRLTMPMLTTYQDKLRELGRSPTMVRKVRISLGALLADAQRRGLVGQNVVHALPRSLRGKEARAAARQKGKLRVGIDIPSPDEIRAIIAAVGDEWRPLLLTAIFTGLRISELRGLRSCVRSRRNILPRTVARAHQRDRSWRVRAPASGPIRSNWWPPR